MHERVFFMIEFLKKYNMHIFIILVAILTAYDILNWNSLSLVRKLVNLFAILGILHEIEEKYWPGGFMELMLKKLKVDSNDFDDGKGKLFVVIFWLVYIGLGYVFDNIIFFFMMTIVLSLFEAFIHTAGIKIHKLNKPYTPGLVTAWLLAILAIYSIIQLNKFNLAGPADYLIGFLLFLISFIILASQVYRSIGLSMKEVMKRIRS